MKKFFLKSTAFEIALLVLLALFPGYANPSLALVSAPAILIPENPISLSEDLWDWQPLSKAENLAISMGREKIQEKPLDRWQVMRYVTTCA